MLHQKTIEAARALKAKKLADDLKTVAAAQMSKYPQYDGHFDDYVLVCVRRQFGTKLGKAFNAQEMAIAKPEADADGYRAVYSTLNRIDTSVPAHIVSDCS